MNRSTARLLAGAALVLVGWLAIFALGGSESQSAGVPAQESPLPGVCGALAAARAGDADDAKAMFFDGAHDGLHDLASRAAEVDRTAAAELLRAKERVEALMESGPASGLRTALDELADATATAVQTRDQEAPSTCP